MTDKTKPRAAATRGGSVIVLPDTGDFGNDVLTAMRAGGTEPVHTATEIDRLVREAQISRGLRAEAGYAAGPVVTILHTRTERLASGKRLGAWLTLSNTTAGDAIYWNVSVMGDDYIWIWISDVGCLESLLAMLRTAAGGPSTEVREYPAEVPPI
jgi:hypothetical protein